MCFSSKGGNRVFDNMHLSTECDGICDEICFVNKINSHRGAADKISENRGKVFRGKGEAAEEKSFPQKRFYLGIYKICI